MTGAVIVPVVDEGLGNSAYLVDLGDGRALAVDVPRDLRAVRAAAGRHGLTVAFAADTHLHADFLSGALQLAADDGAQILASAAGCRAFGHRGLADGDEVDLGGLTLRAWATPGHTAEHLAYLLLDGAQVLGVFTGGSLLVGAAARTDLSGPEQTEPLARSQYASLNRLLTLPDATPVYPTHGAGSFCSAPPGAERITTIGRERATNPLLAAGDEDAFVKALLASLGTFPGYFLRLPEENRRGPAILASAPVLAPLTPGQVRAIQNDGGQVIDVRPVSAYAAGHIPGSLAIPLRDAFATWLGWLVPDPAIPLVIVADPGQDLGEVIWQALKIGYGNLAGTLAGGVPAWEAAGQPVAVTPLLTPGQVDPATVIDVRQASEYAGGHLPGARNIELGALSGQAAGSGGPSGGDHVRARRACRHRRQRAGTRRAHRRGGPDRRPAGVGGCHRAGAGEGRVTTPGLTSPPGGPRAISQPAARRRGPAGPARQPGPVLAAGGRQCPGRRDDRPGAYRAAAARDPGVSPARLHRGTDFHRRLRRGEGGHQLLRRDPVGPPRTQAGPGGGVAGGGADAVPAGLRCRAGAGSSSPTCCSGSTRGSPGPPPSS